MSSAVYITFDEDEGVSIALFGEFCARHGIEHSPRTVGRNVFYAGEVEVAFGEGGDACPEYAEEVTFSTFHMGSALPQVAELARAFWLRFGGAAQADEELRWLFASQPASVTIPGGGEQR